jgi:ribosomal protein S12 methylthiotransferase accessory factor
MRDPSAQPPYGAPHQAPLAEHSRLFGRSSPVAPATSGRAREARTGLQPAETRQRLARVVTASLFTAVPRVRLAPGDPRIFCHTCWPGRAVRDLGRLTKYVHSSGAGFTEESSWLAAAGEGLERYCATKFSQDADFIHGSWKELTNTSPAPETWTLFSQAQYQSIGFPCHPFTRATDTKWYVGVDLFSGERNLLPGPLVCFPYWRRRNEQPITPQTTTGLAFGSSFEEACLYALWEVVERDALALAWNWRLPVKKIDSASGLPSELMDRAGLSQGYTLQLYDITSDLEVPACMAFIRFKDEGRNLLAVGAACRGSLPEAVEKAVLEALQGVPYVRSLCKRQFAQWAFRGDFDEVRSFRHSAVFYSLFPDVLGQYLSTTGEFLNATNTVSVPARSTDSRWSIAATISRLRQLGYSAYAVDMSTAALKNEGLVVARLLVPGLYTLEGAYRFRSLDLARARMAAARLGAVHLANPFPHPLP